MEHTSIERSWWAGPSATRGSSRTSGIERVVARVGQTLGAEAVALARVSDLRIQVIASANCFDPGAARQLVRSGLHAAANAGGGWQNDNAGLRMLSLSPAPGVRLVLAASGVTLDDPVQLGAAAGWIDDCIDLWWQGEQGEARCSGLRAAFSMLEVGGILLDGHGNIVEINDAAAAILERGDALTRDRNRLGADNSEDDELLRQAVIRIIVAGHGEVVPPPQHLLLRRANGAKPLAVAVMRPAQGVGGLDKEPTVLLLIADPDASPRSIASACQMYGLSRNESRLATHLVAGLTIEEIAGEMAVKPDSVRTYLKHIFAKTGVSRQSNLVRLMFMSRLPVDGVRLLPRRATAPQSRSLAGTCLTR